MVNEELQTENNEQIIYLYTRFERFWHWFQALLVIVLLITGLELHGTYGLLGFKTAHDVHIITAWTWLILFAFIIFWMLTTGEWRQYVPTFKKLVHVSTYYCSGIFRGEPHPVPKSRRTKHNPLQRLTYVGIVTVLIPFQIATGFLYYSYNQWPAWGLDWSLSTMAYLHTAGMFAFLAFLIVHLYVITTGHSILAHTKAMISGWEKAAEYCEWEAKTPRGSS